MKALMKEHSRSLVRRREWHLVLVVGVIMVMFDFAGVLLPVDRDDQLGGTPFGIQILGKVFLLRNKPRRFSRRITGIRGGGEFELLGLPLMREIDRHVPSVDGNSGLGTPIQEIHGHGSRLILMNHFRVIFLVTQFNEMAMMRPFLRVGMIVVVVRSGTG